MALVYILYGIGALATVFFGSIALVVLGLGAVINHFGRSEQDDDET